MSNEELKKLHLIQKVIDGQLKQIEAAKGLNLSDRQLRRLIRRVEQEGQSGIIHKLRGRSSHRRLPGKLRQKTLRLYEQRYVGFGPTLASEKLLEREGLQVSKETLRGWLISEGLWHKKIGKLKRHLKWRERKEHCGEMVQMDGSHHHWLEGRGEELVLMGLIDDATNRVYGRFYNYEGTMPAMDVMRRYIGRYGIPTSVYLDRHTTYKSWAKQSLDEQLEGKRSQSHFEKSCEELGIEVIHAYSPQAKGRIERLFKTLQDRLVKELRLAKAKNLQEANKVLERFITNFNSRFNIPAKHVADLHRPVPEDLSLKEVFSICTARSLRNDNTVVHHNRWYQVLSPIRAKQVVVQESLDGTINILNRGFRLRYKVIKAYKKVYVPRVRKTNHRVMPPSNHPWRDSIRRDVQKAKNRTFPLC